MHLVGFITKKDIIRVYQFFQAHFQISIFFFFAFRNKPSPIVVAPLKLRELWSSSWTWKELSMPRLNFKCLVSVISLLSSLSRAKQSWLCLQLSSNNVLPSSYVRLGLQVRAQRLRFWKLPPRIWTQSLQLRRTAHDTQIHSFSYCAVVNVLL